MCKKCIILCELFIFCRFTTNTTSSKSFGPRNLTFWQRPQRSHWTKVINIIISNNIIIIIININNYNSRGDWNRSATSSVLTPVDLKKWAFLFTERNKTQAQAFCKMMQDVAKRMGIQIATPKVIRVGCNGTHHFSVVVVRTRTQPFYPHPHCNRTRTQNIGKKRCSSIGMWGLILKHSLIAL